MYSPDRYSHFTLLPILLLPFMLAGCGDGVTQPCSSSGFINKTDASDTQLGELWQGAQPEMATKPIPLDPVSSSGNITYASPNPKALKVTPDCHVTVTTKPNVLPNSKFPGFSCSESPTGYCAEITLGSGPWTVEIVAPDLLEPGATSWEFQNVILEKLGYNVEGR